MSFERVSPLSRQSLQRRRSDERIREKGSEKGSEKGTVRE